MSELITFSLPTYQLPTLSATDLADVTAPYVHFYRHYHEFIFYYILSGELNLTEGDHTYSLSENQYILLDPTRAHVGTLPSTCQFFYAHFAFPGVTEHTLSDESLKTRLTSERLALSDHPYTPHIYFPKQASVSDTTLLPQLHHLLSLTLETFAAHQHYYQFKSASLLYQLLLSLSEDYANACLYDVSSQTTGSAQTVQLLLSFLNQGYALHITSPLIESKYNCNFDHLNRQFKKVTGQTIFAYLTHLRIEKAKQLLTTGFYTTKEIASRTGFHDVYYFSKVFKKVTGMPPGIYKKHFI